MLRRHLFVLLCTALLVAQTGHRPQPKDDFFPVAVWYSGGKARAPMLEPVSPDSEQRWRADLKQIKKLGFNSVRTWVEWSSGEPREGEYHLENLELLLRVAQEEGLRVLVQYYIDSAPDWVGKKFPDGRYRAQNGEPIQSQAAPGFCFDHAGVRAAALKFVTEVANRAKRSPAFYAYDMWSEPAVINWAEISYLNKPTFCYCPSSQARFRAWLQRKYGTLERLNAAWYRNFANWDDVEPPRFGTILTYTDFMDWRVYIGDKLAEDLRSRADAVRAVDPDHLTTSHAPNPSPLVRTLADIDASDDYLMKNSVDYFGTSFYPKLTSPDRNWTLQRRVLAMDLVKSVTGNRGFYVGELQAGYGVHGVIAGSEVTPEDLELEAWGMVARGARAINFYAYYPMSTGYESGGYGLIELDGTITARAERAGEFARHVQENSELLRSAHPAPAQVAIVFNPLTPLLGGEQNYGSRLAMHQSVAGYHRMFFERNVSVDVVSAREMNAASLADYKLVVLPYPLMMTQPMSDALKAYVHHGGHLWMEARAGWVDENGHAQPALPGFGWNEIAGVREASLEAAPEFAVNAGGEAFRGITFREHFAAAPDARPIAWYSDASPAAYERVYGKGKVAVLGTFVGQANETRPVDHHPLGDLLIRWSAVQPPAFESSAFIELREMTSGNKTLAFFFNHGDKPAHVSYADANDAIEIARGEKISSVKGKVELEIPPLTVRVIVFGSR
jgi:beta-galactosidase